MLHAANNEDCGNDLDYVCNFYGTNLDHTQLESQLALLGTHFNNELQTITLNIIDYLQNLNTIQKTFLCQIVDVTKLLLITPATNAVSEHSGSALCRMKTWLCTTMS